MATLYYNITSLLFIIIGIVSSYGDIFKKKLLNKTLSTGLRSALLLFSLLVFFTVSKNFFGMRIPFSVANISFFVNIFYNSTIGLLAAVFLWYVQVWAAGDAKYFTLAVVLLPLTSYTNHYFKYFPGFILLVNTFFPVFVFVLFSFCLFLLGQLIIFIQKKKAMQEYVQKFIKEYAANIILQLFLYQTVFMLVNIVQQFISMYFFKAGYLHMLVYLGFLLGGNRVQRLFQNDLLRAFCFITFGTVLTVNYFLGAGDFAGSFLAVFRISFVLLIIIQLLNYFFKSYIDQREVQEIAVKDLKAYMLLAVKSEFLLRRDNKYFSKHLGSLYPDGLLEEQVEPVKTWFKKEGIKKIEIYKTFPFIPFIFLGGIITMFFSGSPFIDFAVQVFKGMNFIMGVQLFKGLFLN